MKQTIEVKLTDQRCDLGDAYARKHLTNPPKTAVLSCEGMCLRGEIARRTANLLAHKLAPEKLVRICHGGLLEIAGGMRDLVECAGQVLILDGCGLACGTRLFKGAFPDRQPAVVFTDGLVEFNRELFGVDEMSEEEIQAHVRTEADAVLAAQISAQPGSPVAAQTGCQGSD